MNEELCHNQNYTPSSPCTPSDESIIHQTCLHNNVISINSMVKLLFVTLAMLSVQPTQSFMASTNKSQPIPTTLLHQRQTTLSPLAAAVLDPSPSSYEMSNFAQRMKNLIKKDSQKTKRPPTPEGTPSNLIRLTTLQEFKQVVGDEKDKLVVVRWYAPWCKACKAIAPSFYRLASTFPNVIFVDVPVTPDNANLHQGLGVPSLPYSHIYHPTGRLVEELKISRKHFPFFAKTLKTYVDRECNVDYDDSNGVLIRPFVPFSNTDEDKDNNNN